MKYINEKIAGLALCTMLGTSAVNAASIGFVGTDNTLGGLIDQHLALPGDSFTLSLVGEGFGDATGGGGLDIYYDSSILSITSVAIDSYWNFSFGNYVDVTTPNSLKLGVAAALSTPIDMARQVIANITFNVVSNGTFDFVINQDVSPLHDWFDGTGTKYCTPTVTTGCGPILSMIGSTAVVPVPAAVWLFGSGLLGLVCVARRRKSA